MEVRSEQLDQSNTNKRDIYIKEVISLFKSEFVIEKKEGNHIVKHSKRNDNIRLHYLDIRDHLELFYILDILKFGIQTKFNKLTEIIDTNSQNNLIEKILKDIEKVETYIDNFKYVSENLKKGFIIKAQNQNKNPYEINKGKITENPDYLLACYAR